MERQQQQTSDLTAPKSVIFFAFAFCSVHVGPPFFGIVSR
jgi:hypothetical protein